MKEVLLLITTESDEIRSKNIAKLLIQNKLAACVSIKPIFSIYEWEDKIEDAKEFEITIKSKPELKENLILFLEKVTSYEVPQIIYKNFQAESKYYDWLGKTI